MEYNVSQAWVYIWLYLDDCGLRDVDPRKDSCNELGISVH